MAGRVHWYCGNAKASTESTKATVTLSRCQLIGTLFFFTAMSYFFSLVLRPACDCAQPGLLVRADASDAVARPVVEARVHHSTTSTSTAHPDAASNAGATLLTTLGRNVDAPPPLPAESATYAAHGSHLQDPTSSTSPPPSPSETSIPVGPVTPPLCSIKSVNGLSAAPAPSSVDCAAHGLRQRDAPAAIIDSFLLSYESDALFLRLLELENVVDTFVIVESRESFTGQRRTTLWDTHGYCFDRCVRCLSVACLAAHFFTLHCNGRTDGLAVLHTTWLKNLMHRHHGSAKHGSAISWQLGQLWPHKTSLMMDSRRTKFSLPCRISTSFLGPRHTLLQNTARDTILRSA